MPSLNESQFDRDLMREPDDACDFEQVEPSIAIERAREAIALSTSCGASESQDAVETLIRSGWGNSVPDLPDYTELLDRIDGHLRALRTTSYELTALADLRDDISSLTDHVLRLREENTALGVRVQEGWARIEELEQAARDVLRGGEHEGPCVNYEGQDPQDYSDHEPCSRHVAVAAARDTRLREVLCLDP